MSTERKFTLLSSDGESFQVEEAIAMESQTIKHMIEDDCADQAIPLPNVTGKTLALVIDYCRKHAKPATSSAAPAAGPSSSAAPAAGPSSAAPSAAAAAATAATAVATKKELKAWDANFVNVDQETLFSLMRAADYLDIKGLLELTCQTVADSIKDEMDPEKIRKLFNIENDYTPEEEAQVRKENEWAFE